MTARKIKAPTGLDVLAMLGNARPTTTTATTEKVVKVTLTDALPTAVADIVRHFTALGTNVDQTDILTSTRDSVVKGVQGVLREQAASLISLADSLTADDVDLVRSEKGDQVKARAPYVQSRTADAYAATSAQAIFAGPFGRALRIAAAAPAPKKAAQ